TLADGQIFRRARQKLLAPGAKLLIGPRGTGKTHVMRYTYRLAMKDPAAPLALYATFSRYLNLEPLLKRSPDALQRFHAWVIAKLLLSCFELLSDTDQPYNVLEDLGPEYNYQALSMMVSLLERSSGNDLYASLGQNLTVSHVLRGIAVLCEK